MRGPERIYIAEKDAAILDSNHDNLHSCFVRNYKGKKNVEYVRADLVDNPWIPADQIPEDWKDGRELECWCSISESVIKSYWHKATKGLASYRFTQLEGTHVRLPSKGPSK